MPCAQKYRVILGEANNLASAFPGSARVSRAGERVLAIANFSALRKHERR
jgi:hypothetical protein